MARLKVSIEGDKRIIAKLSSLEKKARNKVFREAVKKTMKQNLLPSVRRALPKRTGTLQKMTKARAMARSRKHVGYYVMNAPAGLTKKQGMSFAGQAYYGGMIEYGTGPRSVKNARYVPEINAKTANRGSVPAGLYYTRVYKQRRITLRNRIEARIKKNLEAAIRGGP